MRTTLIKKVLDLYGSIVHTGCTRRLTSSLRGRGTYMPVKNIPDGEHQHEILCYIIMKKLSVYAIKALENESDSHNVRIRQNSESETTDTESENFTVGCVITIGGNTPLSRYITWSHLLGRKVKKKCTSHLYKNIKGLSVVSGALFRKITLNNIKQYQWLLWQPIQEERNSAEKVKPTQDNFHEHSSVTNFL